MNRNVVEVLNKDGSTVCAVFITRPEYTAKPYEKTFIRFAERPMGSPAAIDAWFYPGRTDGHKFIYPMHGTSAVYGTTNEHDHAYGEKEWIEQSD